MRPEYLIDKIKDIAFSNRSNIKRAVMEGGVVATGLVATRLFAFLVSVLVARSSGVEAFGQYTLFITVFILASEIPNAFDVTYIRFSNASAYREKSEEFLFMDLISIIINAIVVIIVAWLMAPWLAHEVLSKPGAENVIRAGVMSGSIYCVFTTMIASFQQRRKFVHVSILRPLFNMIVLISVASIIYVNFNIDQTILSGIYVSLSFIMAFISLFMFRDVLFKYPHVIKDHARKFFSVGLLLILSAAINQVSSRLDVFFLASLLNYDELGTYGVAVRVSIFISLFTAMLITLILPRASKAREDPIFLKKYLALSLFYIMGQAVVAIILIIWMREFITFVFGSLYVNSVLVASILVVQALFASCAVPFQALIQCGDNPRRLLWANITKLIMSIVMLPVFIHYYGVSGAAIALALVAFLNVVIMCIMALVVDRPRLRIISIR